MIDRRQAFQILRAARVREPAIVKVGALLCIFEGEDQIGRGLTYKQALDDAELLPVPEGAVIPYTTEGVDVRKGGEHIAIAKSRNTALRIANALNAYVPGKQGY
jgi:hypothetical protein